MNSSFSTKKLRLRARDVPQTRILSRADSSRYNRERRRGERVQHKALHRAVGDLDSGIINKEKLHDERRCPAQGSSTSTRNLHGPQKKVCEKGEIIIGGCWVSQHRETITRWLSI